MKRDLINVLVEWRQSSGRKPLILYGARQVGKTTLLKSFGAQHYKNVFYLNFEDTPKFKTLFQEDLDPNNIVRRLALYFKQAINESDSLILFDEIQECPEALNSLKYFKENAPQYHVAAAGSLLGVKIGNKKGFPVGQVNFAHLYPLSFLEFLDAIDETALREYLESIDKPKPLEALFHDKLIALLKVYFFTGGMPEAIVKYIETEDFFKVRQVQQDIIKSYHHDFSKHAASSLSVKISRIWETLPSQLARENKKFIYSVVRQSARAREYEEGVEWLHSAGLIHRVSQISVPKMPISAYANLDVFKIYLLDVGILNCIANLQPDIILNGNELFQEFRGSLTENYVIQALARYHENQFYWASSGRAEIDLVFQQNNDLFPLEIKSGEVMKQKSLQVYAQKFNPKYLLRTSMLNLKLDNNLLNVPLYLVELLPQLLERIKVNG